MDVDLSGVLGIEMALANALSSIVAPDLSSATTMEEVASALQAAGYSIESSLSESELAALPANAPADVIRISRSTAVPIASNTTQIADGILSSIPELAGITFEGNLDHAATLYLTIVAGVDTNGFYLLPGNGLSIDMTSEGGANVISPIASGGADLRTRAIASALLSAISADGRIRTPQLQNELEGVTLKSLRGSSSLGAEFEVDVPGVGRLPLDGRWVWALDPAGGAPAMDSVTSGLSTQGFSDTLAERVGEGLVEISNATGLMGAIVADVPLIGDALKSEMTALFTSLLEDSYEWTDIEAQLRARGFEVLHKVDPTSILTGSFQSGDLLRVRYNQVVSPTEPFTIGPDAQIGST